MTEEPNPYTEDDAWNPETGRESTGEDPLEPIGMFDAVTYYDLLGLDRRSDPTTNEIDAAFKHELKSSSFGGNESKASRHASALVESRQALKSDHETYREMISTLGPRLGHRAYNLWHLAGKPDNYEDVIRHVDPASTFHDDRFATGV